MVFVHLYAFELRAPWVSQQNRERQNWETLIIGLGSENKVKDKVRLRDYGLVIEIKLRFM